MRKRQRIVVYLLLSIVCILLGLATRKLPYLFPSFIVKYGGDTLWALLFFLLLRMVFIRRSIAFVAVVTYGFGVLDELSQLYQAPWINAIRNTFPGQMLLGHYFLWSDLACYAAGVLTGCIIAFFIDRTPRTTTGTIRIGN